MAAAAATTMAATMMEARAMVALMAVSAHDNNNDHDATMPSTMLTLITTRITPKRTTKKGITGGRMAVAAVATAAADQRICRPAPPFVLDNAGTAAIVISVNNAN